MRGRSRRQCFAYPYRFFPPTIATQSGVFKSLSDRSRVPKYRTSECVIASTLTNRSLLFDYSLAEQLPRHDLAVFGEPEHLFVLRYAARDLLRDFGRLRSPEHKLGPAAQCTASAQEWGNRGNRGENDRYCPELE